MRRINKKLVEALDKLIAKYSGEEITYIHKHMKCPLCDLFYPIDIFSKEFDLRCTKCPNYFFGEDVTACTRRGEIFPQLSYDEEENYQTLKQFWTDYKSLYLQRIYTNSEIMEILIKPFKEEKK